MAPEPADLPRRWARSPAPAEPFQIQRVIATRRAERPGPHRDSDIQNREPRSGGGNATTHVTTPLQSAEEALNNKGGDVDTQAREGDPQTEQKTESKGVGDQHDVRLRVPGVRGAKEELGGRGRLVHVLEACGWTTRPRQRAETQGEGGQQSRHHRPPPYPTVLRASHSIDCRGTEGRRRL